MRRILMIAAAVASLAFATAPNPAQAADVGFSLRIGDRYRGEAIRFRDEPDYVVIPGTRIYYVDDYYDRDIYRYGSWWYLVDDGYWYRARSYRGPFIRISYQSVPRSFVYVPTRYRHNWGSSSGYFRYRTRYSDDRYYRDRDYRYRRDRDWRDRDRNWDRDRDWRDRDWRDRDYDRDWDRDRDWRDR